MLSYPQNDPQVRGVLAANPFGRSGDSSNLSVDSCRTNQILDAETRELRCAASAMGVNHRKLLPPDSVGRGKTDRGIRQDVRVLARLGSRNANSATITAIYINGSN